VPTQDEVRLAVPATPEFLRLARVTATGLASRLGFTYDEVEDLRLAIDELCYTLIGNSGRRGQVSLRYLMTSDGLQIEGIGQFDDGAEEPTISDLTRQILRALVDSYEVGRNTSGHPSFQLVKRTLASRQR